MELPVMPRGFDPTKEELISYHLKNKIKKIPYPESWIISDEVAIYDLKQNPWETFSLQDSRYKWQPVMDSLGNEVADCHRFFAFSRLSNTGTTRKSRNIQKKRSTGWGTWHGTSKLHEVHSSERLGSKLVVGNYRVLTFRTNNDRRTVGQWTIYEYTIDSRGHPDILKFPEWEDQVVCEIRRDDTKFSIGRKVYKNDDESMKTNQLEAAEAAVDDGTAAPSHENQGSAVTAAAAVQVKVEEAPVLVGGAGDGAAEPDYYKELDEVQTSAMSDEMLDGIIMF